MGHRHRISVTAGAINEVCRPDPDDACLETLLVHVNTAPTTAGTFTVKLLSGYGAAFDTVLYALDLAAGATTDIFAELPLALAPDDKISVAYANADNRTIGVQLVFGEER